MSALHTCVTIQLPLSVKLRDSSVFDSFFAGRNESTVDILRRLRPGEPPTCVFLHGASGTGKTHLLQAICAQLHAHAASAVYLPLKDVAVMGPDILAGCGDFGCVCIDDVEEIAGNAAWERALFGLHQQLDEKQARLVVSGAAPPAASGIALADLRSRLGGGLVLTLQSLDEPEQIEALRLRAQIRGFELPVETAQYLLRRLPRDMSSLWVFLDQLDEASLAAQRKLTVPFVREVMERDKTDE